MTTIRMARAGDATALAEMNLIFNRVSVSAPSVAATLRRASEQVAVAVCGGRPVGFACAQVHDSFCYPSPYAEITEVFVAADHRREHLASRLVAFLEDRLTRRGVTHLHVLTGVRNRPARALYEKLGYRNNRARPEILYEKDVPASRAGPAPDAVSTAGQSRRQLQRVKLSDGRRCTVSYTEQLAPAAARAVLRITRSLAGRWFTANVPSNTEKDLPFHRSLTATVSGRVAGFLLFTSQDGAISITLLGVDPDLHGRGIGQALLAALREMALELGFDTIRAFTTPPDANPAFAATLRFYEKAGFRKKKLYRELWEYGAIELEWRL